MQKSCTGDHYAVPIFILFIKFHNPKEPCKEETEKRASSFLPPPMSSLRFHFILLSCPSFFLNYFYLLTYLDGAIPALHSLKLVPRPATCPGAISKAYGHHHLEKNNEPDPIVANSENYDSVVKSSKCFTQSVCFSFL